MNNLGKVQRLLATVKYRPGWTITPHSVPYHPDKVWLHIDGPLIDAENHSLDTRVDVRAVVPTFDAFNFYDWLAYRLRWIEIHESREFYNVFGVPWDSPHQDVRECKCEYRVKKTHIPISMFNTLSSINMRPAEMWQVTRCVDGVKIGEYYSQQIAEKVAWENVVNDDLAKSKRIMEKLK